MQYENVPLKDLLSDRKVFGIFDEEYVVPWLEAVKTIAPQQVMVYTIDRETPAHGLLKATHEQLDAIRDRVVAVGIPCSASY